MTQPTFSSYIRREREALYLVFEGAIDVATAAEAQTALQRFTTEYGPSVVLDMSRVNFIDSKGLGTLISAAKTARDAGGQIYIHRPALPVVKILEICQLTSLFPPAPAPAEEPPAEPAAATTPRTATRARAGTTTGRR
jgi:anti-anti-sigma factor